MDAVYHTTQPTSVTSRAEYAGRRHARLTRSMKQLPPAQLKLLVELRYMLKDGESRAISNAMLKTRTGYSEGYISVLARQLAGETVSMRSNGKALIYPALPQRFIERVWSEQAGGFVITMLPPPELRTVQPPSHAAGDQRHDPLAHTHDTASCCGETSQIGDHEDDPSIHDTSMHAQQQPAQTQEEIIAAECSARQATDQPAADEGLVIPSSDERPAQVYPQQWVQILRANSGYTAQDFARELAHAAARPDVKHPVRLVVGVRARGECVYSQAEIDARAAALSPGGAARPDAPGRTQRSSRAAFAHHIPPGQISAAEAARVQHLADRARALAPPHSPDVVVVELMDLLERGLSDADALAALAAAPPIRSAFAPSGGGGR